MNQQSRDRLTVLFVMRNLHDIGCEVLPYPLEQFLTPLQPDEVRSPLPDALIPDELMRVLRDPAITMTVRLEKLRTLGYRTCLCTLSEKNTYKVW
jgi:hypothetical protein